MKRAGFTLIEVAIGSLIGSLLLAGLYMTITTLSKTMFRLNERHDQLHELMVVYDLFEKDLTSQFVALDLLKTGTEQVDPNVGFVCLAKDKKVDYISCVCMHPRPQYNSIKPAPVRVVYQFLYNNKESTAFLLQRYESNTLSWPACKKEIDEKKLKGLLLSDAMRDFDISLFAYSRVEKPKDESEKKYSQHRQWDPQDIYKKTKRLIPDFISCKALIGTPESNLSLAADFTVLGYDPEIQEEKKPQQPPANNGKAPPVTPKPPVPSATTNVTVTKQEIKIEAPVAGGANAQAK
jgi:prepilin-type N-terminal cleavage/methylation domain-containing protein